VRRRWAETEPDVDVLKLAKGSTVASERREGEWEMVGVKSHEAIESLPLADGLRPGEGGRL
jgi:hypothetical protein